MSDPRYEADRIVATAAVEFLERLAQELDGHIERQELPDLATLCRQRGDIKRAAFLLRTTRFVAPAADGDPAVPLSDRLMAERRAIRDVLAGWWDRWAACFRETVGDGDPGASLYPIDDWARETAEQTAARINNSLSEAPPHAAAVAALSSQAAVARRTP